MNHDNLLDDFEDYSEDKLNRVTKKSNSQRQKGKTLLRQKGNQQLERKVNPFNEADYPFTYHASQHEKEWLLGSISEFYEQNWFEDILAMAKGGKEASVYLCRTPQGALENLLALKVYRPRRFRNLKKDHLYREGRENLDAEGKVVLDERAYHAMQKRSSYGKELLHTSWVGHEYLTLQILYEAGADIPKPYASSTNAILMGYVGDEAGTAPSLNSVSLTTAEANALFQRVMHNVELMLANNRIHADLSAYNILYWEGEITLIDFPQAIAPDENHNAWRIFARDVQRVCDYFSAQGVHCDAEKLARGLWQARGRAFSPELDPHYLDPDNEEDRRAIQRKED
jgi:RIO kinase 1